MTASGWQYTTSVSTMRSSSRGAERKRKRKRGDLKWRQGISIGQHSSDTYVLWRSISVRIDYATDHSFLLALHIRGGVREIDEEEEADDDDVLTASRSCVL